MQKNRRKNLRRVRQRLVRVSNPYSCKLKHVLHSDQTGLGCVKMCRSCEGKFMLLKEEDACKREMKQE